MTQLQDDNNSIWLYPSEELSLSCVCIRDFNNLIMSQQWGETCLLGANVLRNWCLESKAI